MIGLWILKQHVDGVDEKIGAIRSLLAGDAHGQSPEPPAASPGVPPAVSAPIPVDRGGAIAWVSEHATDYGLDAAAVLAVAEQEGLGGGIGDGGLAYGPWQDHMTEFAGRPWYGAGRNNQQVQQWAWSPAGFDYVMRQMVIGGARGLTGRDAIAAIVHGYERSADQPGEIARATAQYNKWRGNL